MNQPGEPAARTLVAGVGNIFLGDDAFGVAVARRLAAGELPPRVRAADFGIRGIHLAYDILDANYDFVILVDAVAHGGTPGDLYVIEPDLAAQTETESDCADAHSMSPDAVIGLLRKLGALPKRLLLVGCEPRKLEEEIGLSETIAGAVDKAAQLILQLLASDKNAQGDRDARIRPM